MHEWCHTVVVRRRDGAKGRGRERERERERERKGRREGVSTHHDYCMIVLSQLSESDVFAKTNISNEATFVQLCQCSELVDAILRHN